MPQKTTYLIQWTNVMVPGAKHGKRYVLPRHHDIDFVKQYFFPALR